MTHRRQKGIALIITLATVALFFVLASMCMTAGQSSRISGKIHSRRGEARYAAESTTAYVQWMIISDRLSRPASMAAGSLGRNPLGEAPAEGDEASLWRADGNMITLDLNSTTKVSFRILDANRGHDISGRTPGRRIRRDLGLDLESNPDEVKEIETFLDSLDDYTDGDEFVRLHGHEAADYERMGEPGLPRNDPLIFAEEAYWIPGIRDFIPELGAQAASMAAPEDLLRIIPPANRNFPNKPAFFSSTLEMIQSIVGLTEEEMQVVRDARQQWYEGGIPIRETLGDLYNTIAGEMSFDESGIYTLEVTAIMANGDMSRRVITTLEMPRLPRQNPPEPFMIWQRTVD